MTETKASIKALSITIGSKVTIVHDDMRGVVRSVLMNVEGIQYSVSFWRDGARRIEWVYGDEISEGWE